MPNWLLRLFSFWPSSARTSKAEQTEATLFVASMQPETQKQPPTTRRKSENSRKPTAKKKGSGLNRQHRRQSNTKGS